MKLQSRNWLFRSKNNYNIHKTLSLLGRCFMVVFCLFCSVCISQTNLVPNPSFETYTSCPNAGGQINYAFPWTGTSGGEEYFNSCSSVYSVPFQNFGSSGFQYARTGNAFAALFALNGYGSDYREYLQVQLNDTLQVAKCYLISFYANLQNPINIAVNNLGLYVSTTLFTTATPFGVAPYTPQILKYNNSIIDDTLAWTMISGIYTAIGGEKYISIGNFFDDLSTDTMQTGHGAVEAAYYYIDDVSVIPIDSMPSGMPAYAGPDTNVILGDSVFIGQQISNLNCNWYNATGSLIASNTSGIFVSPTVIGNTFYVVEQNLCGIITTDTVQVTVLPVGIDENEWAKNIKIYPNPTVGEFTLDLNGIDKTQWLINITDVQGRSFVNEIFNASVIKLKPEVENGVYLVHIVNVNTNEITIRKLIIQK